MLSISDHLAQLSLFNLDTMSHTSCKVKYTRNFKNFDRQTFQLEIASKNWDNLICLNSSDPELCTSLLIKHVNQLIDKHAPLVKEKPKQKAYGKPWLKLARAAGVHRSNSDQVHSTRCNVC